MCSDDENMAVFWRQPCYVTTLHVAWLSRGNLFLSSGSVVVSLRSTLESVDEVALLIVRCVEWPYSTVSPRNTKCLVSLVSQLISILLSIFPRVHAYPTFPPPVVTASLDVRGFSSPHVLAANPGTLACHGTCPPKGVFLELLSPQVSDSTFQRV